MTDDGNRWSLQVYHLYCLKQCYLFLSKNSVAHKSLFCKQKIDGLGFYTLFSVFTLLQRRHLLCLKSREPSNISHWTNEPRFCPCWRITTLTARLQRGLTVPHLRLHAKCSYTPLNKSLPNCPAKTFPVATTDSCVKDVPLPIDNTAPAATSVPKIARTMNR